jgi:hypothetical protein
MRCVTVGTVRKCRWCDAAQATAGVVRMLTKGERKAAKDREKRVAQRVRRAA